VITRRTLQLLVVALLAVALLWQAEPWDSGEPSPELAVGEGIAGSLPADLAGAPRSSEPEAAGRSTPTLEPGADMEAPAPDRSLAIQVIDEGGAPVQGVLVALEWRRPDYTVRAWTARTEGPRGEALTGPLADVAGRGSTEGELYATFGFLLDDRPRVAVDRHDPPAEPIRLVLPPTGSLAVHVSRGDGRPLHEEVQVRLRRAPRSPHPSSLLQLGTNRQKESSQQGVAFFSHVGLGLDLEIECWGPPDCESVSLRAPGPTLPGERLEVDLCFAEIRPGLTGRVLRPDGSPAACRELESLWRVTPSSGRLDEPSEYDEKELVTDELGRFHTFLTAESSDGDAIALFIRDEQDDGLQLECACELPSVLGPGERDLGDLILQPSPLIAAGRVVDERGEGLTSVGVCLMRREYEDETGEDFYWDLLGWFHNDTTDESGAFEIRGELEEGEYALRASPSGFRRAEPLPFLPGSRDLLIRLGRDTVQGIVGSLLLDEGIPSSSLRVGALCDHTDCWEASFGEQHELHLGEDGRFSASLDPGRFEVHVQLAAGEVPLIEPVAVHLEPDQIAWPPALQGIDLRGALHELRLRVEDEGGRGLDSWIAFGPPGTADWPAGIPIGEGHAALISPWPALDLLVSAPGHLSQRIEAVGEKRRIGLRTGIPVRLRLTRAVALPEGAHLELRLTQSDEEPYDLPLVGRRIRGWIADVVPGRIESGEFDLALPSPGLWRLVWLLDLSTAELGYSALLEAPDPGLVLDVPDADLPLAFELDPPRQEAIDEVLRASRR